MTGDQILGYGRYLAYVVPSLAMLAALTTQRLAARAGRFEPLILILATLGLVSPLLRLAPRVLQPWNQARHEAFLRRALGRAAPGEIWVLRQQTPPPDVASPIAVIAREMSPHWRLRYVDAVPPGCAAGQPPAYLIVGLGCYRSWGGEGLSPRCAEILARCRTTTLEQERLENRVDDIEIVDNTVGVRWHLLPPTITFALHRIEGPASTPSSAGR